MRVSSAELTAMHWYSSTARSTLASLISELPEAATNEEKMLTIVSPSFVLNVEQTEMSSSLLLYL